MKIVMIGTGYVGLFRRVFRICFDVTCVDLDAQKIEQQPEQYTHL